MIGLFLRGINCSLYSQRLLLVLPVGCLLCTIRYVADLCRGKVQVKRSVVGV